MSLAPAADSSARTTESGAVVATDRACDSWSPSTSTTVGRMVSNTAAASLDDRAGLMGTKTAPTLARAANTALVWMSVALHVATRSPRLDPDAVERTGESVGLTVKLCERQRGRSEGDCHPVRNGPGRVAEDVADQQVAVHGLTVAPSGATVGGQSPGQKADRASRDSSTIIVRVEDREWGFRTRAIHAGNRPDADHRGPRRARSTRPPASSSRTPPTRPTCSPCRSTATSTPGSPTRRWRRSKSEWPASRAASARSPPRAGRPPRLLLFTGAGRRRRSHRGQRRPLRRDPHPARRVTAAPRHRDHLRRS